ncbi:hypothetical protein DFQ28_003671 [Apophysomyces sp. BC1034]|nr:hypothetical protein DFQ30_003705 [Apophysomyces sp. BC1015]KAG0178923.1 hypothetical protein DFQ29_002832 [Apophysomyces sp. BC1021]KAG0189258.1 hypothetical protein DFQ28_003671 [Apophysomyces sp. BC1034]
MKFSLAATSALLLTAFASLAKADEYADAMKEWCQGLTVTTPTNLTVVVAGQNAEISVTRVPNNHQKTITGLDLYSVSQDGKAQYIQNVWHGEHALNTAASINDTMPANATAGLYYYRVWVTNMMNGMHGPDCIETSSTFKVTTGVHQNVDGFMYYTENLDDITFYRPEHIKGCFGLSVDQPKEGSTFKHGDHISVVANRDKSSQTESLLKVELYKATEANKAEFVATAWEGSERFIDAFSLKDHLALPEDKIDPNAQYYYLLDVTSNKVEGETCTFRSGSFKIEKSA